MTDDVSVTDPINNIISKVRELAFHTAIQTPRVSPNMANATQVVQYIGQAARTVYRSNFTIMGVAVLLNFLGVVSTLPLFWRWWQLGRSVSLSPLEVENAFEAPLMREVHGNATQKQIRERIGRKKVRYSETFGLAEETF
jgi:hypothetical protein